MDIYITCFLQILSFSSRFRWFEMEKFLYRPTTGADDISWLVTPPELVTTRLSCHTLYNKK